MSWACRICDGKLGAPILITYASVRGGVRHSWHWCSVCDAAAFWPQYERTEPPLPRETP